MHTSAMRARNAIEALPSTGPLCQRLLSPLSETFAAEIGQYLIGMCGEIYEIQGSLVGTIKIIVPVYHYHLPAAISIVSFDIVEFSASVIMYAEEILAVQNYHCVVGPAYFRIIDVPIKIHVRTSEATGPIDHRAAMLLPESRENFIVMHGRPLIPFAL
jgi:hypothetical protein